MAADSARGGAGAEQPRRKLPLLVAPTTVGNTFNTLRPPLRPVACWRLDDMRFEFDSSIIKPEARAELPLLARLWKKVGRAPLSVFGHADPVGTDDYNKTLSGRRASSVYALLTRDVDGWERLYSQPFGGDNWQTVGLDGMRQHGGSPSSQRRAIFEAYMEYLCVDDDGEPFRLEKSDFLGGGRDAGGKADYQGCSEFNPILLFSRAEDALLAADTTERNRENAPNRRVTVFLFPPGTVVDPSDWPCPRASEGSAGCRAEFWPDGDQRRAQGSRRRTYERDRDTFACAFYDRMARLSPCELMRKTLRLRLFGDDKNAIPRAPYELRVGADDRKGTADQQGILVETEVLAPGRFVVAWGDPRTKQQPTPLSFEVEVNLDIDPDDFDEEAVRYRLKNLGYPWSTDLADALKAFQRDYGLTESGQLDAPTKQKLAAAADRGVAKNEMGGNGAR